MSMPEREAAVPVIPSKGYVLELVTGPLDDEDKWLIREEACDAV